MGSTSFPLQIVLFRFVSSAWNCTFLRTYSSMHVQAYRQCLSVLLTCALHDKGISLDVPRLWGFSERLFPRLSSLVANGCEGPAWGLRKYAANLSHRNLVVLLTCWATDSWSMVAVSRGRYRQTTAWVEGYNWGRAIPETAAVGQHIWMRLGEAHMVYFYQGARVNVVGIRARMAVCVHDGEQAGYFDCNRRFLFLNLCSPPFFPFLSSFKIWEEWEREKGTRRFMNERKRKEIQMVRTG